MHRPATFVIAALLTLGATPVGAQSSAWTDRSWVSVSGDYQFTSTSFVGTSRPIAFVEPGRVETSYQVKSTPEFDVAAGVRVWRNLALGASVSRFSQTGSGTVSAQVPHPFYFGRARGVSGDASGLTRDETAVHVQAVWVMLPSPRWQVDISGGPSLFVVSQGIVQDVTIAQSYPFDTATYTGVVSERRSRSGMGFNAGATITRFVASRVGIGMTASFSRARLNLPSPDGDTLAVDAGGAHVGAGIRVRF